MKQTFCLSHDLFWCGLTFVLNLSLCLAQETRSPDSRSLMDLFNYSKDVPLGVREAAREQRGDIVVRDLVFNFTPEDREVKAYLVSPSGAARSAGILWVHWLGEEKSNRTQFLDEAVALASKGTVSLLVDAMWADSGWYGKRVPEEDYSNSIRQVVELRRAMDFLLSQPNVDSRRIAVVGHDYGGMYATIMGGVDQRAKTYVLIAVTPSLNDWAYFGTQPKSHIEYVRQNAVLELPMYLRQIKNASILFQFGKQDFYVSGAGAAIYFRSANEPKERKWYESDHAMEKPEIKTDRQEWLIKELGLK